MTKIKKCLYFSLAALIMFVANPQTASAATRLTPTHLYTWARQGNVTRLHQFQRYINLQDRNHNTALCIAQHYKDQRSYSLLLKFGASTKVSCHDDNDPICAVIAGEKTKIAPAAWWLLGLGAAAGAYALIHNGSKDDPTPTCPTGYDTKYQSAADCGTQGASGWTYTSSGEIGGKACGKCTPKTCSIYNAVSNVNQCQKYNTLIASLETTPAGYAGDEPCYKCTYKCKADLYTSKSQCENDNTGYSCKSTTENGITCWAPDGPLNCPTGYTTQYQSVTDCGSQGSNGWTYTSSGTSGDKKCGKCTPKTCATYSGVKNVTDCPKYNTLKEALDTNAVGYAGEEPCYKCTYTCKADLYTSKSECESDNTGYTCKSTTENGITCWAPDTPTNCPTGYTTQYQSVTDCGSQGSNGWTYTSSGTSGSQKCGKCTPKTCATYGGVANVTDCPKYNTLKEAVDTNAVGYAGETPCYKCTYTCKADLYTSKSECESDNTGYNCSSTTENGITCWAPNTPTNCPTGYTTQYQSVTDCGEQGANGWTYTSSGTSGSQKCGKCTPKTCATYGGVYNVTECPKYNTLKEAVDTNAIGYSGDQPCYKCTYTCKSDLYTSKSECEGDNTGYNCTSTTENGITCWAPNTPTNCPTGYTTQYQSVTDCGSQGSNGWTYTSSGTSGSQKCGKCTPKTCSSYGGVYNVTECPKYNTLKEAVDTNAIGYSGETPCYNCTYTCKSDLYTSKSECEDDNDGYTCSSTTENGITCWAPGTPSSCPTGYSTSYPSVTACGTQGANGWSYTSSGTSGGINCGKCSKLSCNRFDMGELKGVTSVTECPAKTGMKAAATNAVGYTGDDVCYRCSYTCASDSFDSEADCTDGGYTCSSTTVGSLTCWYHIGTTNCATGYSTNYQSVTDCGSQGSNGWTYSSSGSSNGLKCGKCTPKTCASYGGVANVTDCTKYNTLKEAVDTNAIGYSGETPCYECTYTCKSSYYTSKSECEDDNDGYTCASTTENGITCWAPGTPSSCPTGYSTSYPSVTACGTQGANGWSYTASGTSGGVNCGKCSKLSCNRFDMGELKGVTSVSECPAKTGMKAAATNAVGYTGDDVCYRCSYTCASDAFDNQADCTDGGYTCSSTTVGSLTCWYQVGTSSCATGYSTNYQSVTDCGAQGANGWSYTSSGSSSGLKCGKCTPLSCSRFNMGDLKGVSSVTECPSYNGMKAAATNAVGYTGDETCYRCSYSCKVNYSDQEDCEFDTDKVCASTTVGSLTCWYPTNTTLTSENNMTMHNMLDVNRTTSGSENIIGVETKSDFENTTNEFTGKGGNISITHNSTGNAIGIKASEGNKVYNREDGTITIINNNGGTATGIYLAQSAKIANDGTITIIGDSGTAYGIYGEGNNTIINHENGIIDVSGTDAYGIYVKDGTDTYIKNAGTIYANGENAHGIYVDENSTNATVVNTGKIYLNGTSAGDAGITLNGGKVRNMNLMSFSGATDFNAMDAVFYLEDGGVYEAESLSGDLNVGTSNVLGGNRDTYINEGGIRASDIENLNLASESALFNAHIVNNGDGSSDVVLERKDFAEFTPNNSIANYLEQNYQAGNMENMYDNIKLQSSQPNVSATIAQDLGYDVLPNFAQENYIALKSLNRNISDTVLTPTNETNRIIAGGDYMNIETDNKGFLSGYELNSSSMYTFGDKRLDNKNRLGLGLSITHLDTNYDKGGDRKLNIFNLFVPYMHKFTNNLNWASILSVGYGDGEYDRGNNKESDIKDIFYGWANELRYTMDLNGFAELEPALMLNALGYTEDGFDEGDGVSLISKKTHNMSVEAGLGLFLKKSVSLQNYGKLGFKIGGVYYHELADQYDDIKAKQRGATGWYKINDYANIYDKDRAVVEAGVDYEYKRVSLYAKYNQLIERNDPKLVDLGLKYNF